MVCSGDPSPGLHGFYFWVNYTVAGRLQWRKIIFSPVGIRTRAGKGRSLIGKAERWLPLRMKLSETLTRVMDWPRTSQGWPGEQGSK